MTEYFPASRGAGWRTYVIRVGAALIIAGALAMPVMLMWAI